MAAWSPRQPRSTTQTTTCRLTSPAREMAVEKVERLAVLVGSLRQVVGESGHRDAVGQPQALIQQADPGKFGQRVPSNGVGFWESLGHEGTRADQGGHLGIVEGVAQVDLEDLVLA